MSYNIESYNASYPLAFYEVGNIYSFYGTRVSGARLASDEQIRRYSGLLLELENRELKNAISPVGSGQVSEIKEGEMYRYYAVVVEKIIDGPKIKVMYRAQANGIEQYYIRAYAVNKGCSSDGQDYMAPSSSVNALDKNSKALRRVGGITLDEGKRKVGGITLDEGNNIR